MWSSIAAYADKIGVIEIDAFERFVALIKAMDAEYREFVTKRATKPQKS